MPRPPRFLRLGQFPIVRYTPLHAPYADCASVAMRFDLTVPLARFAAQYAQELGTPFRRYHIASVWRGERPARGRFREFMQCDFDTVGTLSNSADIETLFVINDLLEGIGIERFTIRVNNRKVLNRLLEKSGLQDHAVGILRALDKLDALFDSHISAHLRNTTLLAHWKDRAETTSRRCESLSRQSVRLTTDWGDFGDEGHIVSTTAEFSGGIAAAG